jgi:hypothetical protein
LGRQPALVEQTGATMLEYSLLLAAIAIPSYWAIKAALGALIGHYRLMTMLNGMPFP